jgi:hypothetical protein
MFNNEKATQAFKYFARVVQLGAAAGSTYAAGKNYPAGIGIAVGVGVVSAGAEFAADWAINVRTNAQGVLVGRDLERGLRPLPSAQDQQSPSADHQISGLRNAGSTSAAGQLSSPAVHIRGVTPAHSSRS